MYKNALRPAWVEINLNNLDFNIKNIKAKIGDREMIGVIKADAYGHGSVKVAEVLRANGCKTFAIATIHEAITLREAGATEEIILLGLAPDMYAEAIVKYDITPVVCDSSNAAAIDKAAAAAGKLVRGLIAVDTGMGRIGYLADEAEAAAEDVKKIQALENFKIKGMFSHMSTADAYDKTYSHQQEEKYNKFIRLSLRPASIFLLKRWLTALPSWNSRRYTSTPAVPVSFSTDAILLTKWIKTSWPSSLSCRLRQTSFT